MKKKPILCPYTLGGINYKNGFVTSCPQQSDYLYVIDNDYRPSKIINSEGFRAHRKEMMSGIWSKGCHLCKEAEEINSNSMRQDLEGFQFNLDYYDELTGKIDLQSVFHAELRFSNSCNMACLHCADVFSSGWESKLKHYKTDDEDEHHQLIQLMRIFHKKPNTNYSISVSMDQMKDIVNDLNKNFPNICKVDFTGGEVLHQKQFYPCLELLSKHPNAKNLEVTFHTNFNAKFNEKRLAELLNLFGTATMHISIDAGTNIYSYFRSGSWDTLQKNIESFKKINNNCTINAVCTTSAYQIMDIENIFRSLIELDFNYITSSIVYTPNYLNPALMKINFPTETELDIDNTIKFLQKENSRRFKNLEKYKKLRSWKEVDYGFTDITSAINGLNKIKNYVFNKSVKHSEWDAFMVYIKKTDKIWKQSFNEHMKNYKFTGTEIIRVNNE